MADLSPYARHEFVVEGSNDSWSNLFGFIPAGSRVLDVGCSTGNFGEALERTHGCTVVGVDIFETDIDIARTRISRAEVRDVTVAGALDDLGEFDVIIFADVLEHLADPRAALLASAKALREGGAILYSIPNMTHLSVRLDLLGGTFGYTETGILDKTHLHFWDRVAVDDLFATSGLSITDERSVTFPYPPRWIAEQLARLGLTARETGFAEMLAATDADVLQLVGRAVVPVASGDSGASDRGRSSPGSEPIVRHRTFPPEEISAYASQIEVENTRLAALVVASEERERVNVAEARHRAESFEQQLAAVQAKLTGLRQHPVKTVLGQVTKRLRKH